MGISERKVRDKAERESRIVATARAIAEKEGWDAVTIRRLAQDIEYSQPVIYSHFTNREAIVGAVAIEGFGDMAEALWAAGDASSGPREAVEAVATAFLDFAFGRPAIYEAMFVLPSGLRFARSDTPPQLRATFGALMAVIRPFCDEAELATETFWSALHGLAELERSGRIRPAFRSQRLVSVVDAISQGRAAEAPPLASE